MSVSIVSSVASPFGAGIKCARVWDQKTEGTNGGSSSSNAFTSQRTLQTLSDPDNIGISVASNKVSFPAGRYQIVTSAPFFECADAVIRHWNVTTNALIDNGQVTYGQAATVIVVQAWCWSLVTFATTTEVQVDYHVGNATATNGLGVATSGVTVTGHVEIYTVMNIIKY